MIDRTRPDQVTRANKQRMIAFATIVALLQLVICSVAVSGIKRLRTEATDLRTATTSLERLVSETTHGATTGSRSVPENVFEQIESSMLIREVAEYASVSDCTITAMQPVESADQLAVNHWSVILSGDYNCVGGLIESLEQSEFITDIGKVTITSSRSRNVVDATIAINIWDTR